jgi:hypothetical protein
MQDGWSRALPYYLWMRAFEDAGADPRLYATAQRSTEEILRDFNDIAWKNASSQGMELAQRAKRLPLQGGCNGCGCIA